MPRLNDDSKFASYVLTSEEELSGSTLSDLQKAVIQNLICREAERQVALVFDPLNPTEFGIQQAYHTGKIEVLQELLAISQEAIEEQLNKAQSE